MHIKKRVVFSVFSTLFLLTLIPEVFALFEFLYFGGAIDPLDLYRQWQGWFDFTLITAFMVIFLSIFLPIALGAKEEEQKQSMQKLAVILGLIIGLGVSYFGRQYFAEGLILGLGPLWIFFFMFILVFMLYRTAKGEGEGKLGIGVVIFLLFATLLLAGIIFPGIYGPIANLLFGNALIGAIIMILGTIGFLALLLWILGMLGGPFKWLRGKWGGGGTTSRGDGRGSGGREPPEVPPTIIKKRKIRDVKIETIPPGPYSPGQEIVLRAIIKEVGGIPFTSRETHGEFMCTWKIGNLVLRDHSQNITWQIPQAMINMPEQGLRIQVEVIDEEAPYRKGRGSTIIKVRGGIPELRIIEPIDTSRQHSLEKTEGEELKFKFIFDPSKPAPKEVASAAWFFIEGHLTEIDEKTIKKATPIADGNEFTEVIGQDPLNLNPEIPYTIICVAVDKKRRPYTLPIVKKLLEAHFTLIVKKGKKPTPPPPPTGEEPKFFVNVEKLGDKTSQVLRTETNSDFNANLKEKYTFTSEVENDDIDNYEINMAINSDDLFRKIAGRPDYFLELKSPGTKKVTCVFQKKGSSKSTIIPGTTKSIQITINVGKSGTPPPPAGTGKTELKITKVNNVAVRTGMTVPLALDENITIEVDSQDPENKIEEYLWYAEKGGQREPLARLQNKRAILKFSGEKYFPEEYKILVVAGSQGKVLNHEKGDIIFDYFIARFIAFVVDSAFKSNIDEIKETVGTQASILSKIAEELKKKEPDVKELIGDFNDVELALQEQLKVIQSKAEDLKSKGKINEFMAKAVRDWALRVAQPLNKQGEPRMGYWIGGIDKYVDAKEIENAVKALYGSLVAAPDPKMKFKGGYFTRRKAAVNEVN